TANRQPVRVGPALFNRMTRGIDGIFHIHHAPLLAQQIAVLAPVASAATVVHIYHRDATLRPILDVGVEARHRLPRGAAMNEHHRRRTVGLWCSLASVVWRI